VSRLRTRLGEVALDVIIKQAREGRLSFDQLISEIERFAIWQEISKAEAWELYGNRMARE
jgi:hypothetical protein